MGDFPLLVTTNLLLTAFTPTDAAYVQLFAGESTLIEMLDNAPWPYPDGAAQRWIATHPDLYQNRQAIYLAIRLRGNGQVIGCVELHDLVPQHRAELGYWIALPWQGQGYASEAVRALVEYAFDALALRRLDATVFTRNIASITLLEKLGMQREGLRPGWGSSRGNPEDVYCYGLTRARWNARTAAAGVPPDTVASRISSP
ncbi:GNAT family protein [Silvimonas sp.]|uniref:GNAT family N-acetyltransferase n=1 Tax=Silvimonas sp. TaxID=2650811 RepID=UPI00284429AF|nr:GNAT family protein [Silvimonas sp.]MDR3425850.1 GNAT family protein [Silvimonas sp.]